MFLLRRSSSRLPIVARVTPLNLREFQKELSQHPDRARVAYVVDGIRDGFRTGFVSESVSARRNMLSASEHPSVIDSYLALEVSKNRVSGPFAAPPISGLQCSPFGVIPKKSQPGKWRLILDLSSPNGHSVNDGTSREQFSLRYISVDTAITVLMELGPGALMAKFDVECAYRNIPIHESERYLLGMRWRDQYFVDLTLPFGLRSAPYILDSVGPITTSGSCSITGRFYHSRPRGLP